LKYERLLLSYIPANNPSDMLVINATTKHFANIGGASSARTKCGSTRATGATTRLQQELQNNGPLSDRGDPGGRARRDR
jgi:hypothetical protein